MVMKTIEFEIEGICPLLMDKYIDGNNAQTGAEALKFAPQKAYRDDNGNLSIPADALKASIREAAREVGKKMEKSKRAEEVRSQIFIEPFYLSMKRKDFDLIDGRAVKRQKGKGIKTTVMTYRPLIKEWSVKGKINIVNPSIISTEHLRQCLEVAGLCKGLLGYRPEFGRFKIKKFEETEEN